MTINPPDPSSRVVDQAQRIDPVWDRFLRNMWRRVAALDTRADETDTSKADATQTWVWSTLIQTAADVTYDFPNVCPNGTIEDVTTYCRSGTCTVTVNIDDTALGGSANSASTTIDRTYHGTRNAMTDESDLSVTITSNASALDLTVVIRGTQTLEAS